MVRCRSCAREMPEESLYCSACGVPLRGPGAEATLSAATASSFPSGPSSTVEGRFTPGTVLARRYRILGLLGRGGMGEVCRAWDLQLNQDVALKFLPQPSLRDPAALARLRQEVRIARQVSHPNVCRVYDLGETDGLHFLSMEYVDGENLRSLLQRIGRLPSDKALQITRKLCAALAAAHDKGVLHRDLKPANIMIDGRGQVLVTDFGLAVLAGEQAAADAREGTPAYMAPEQLAGQEVTARSDIYALGLVMYEMFTGRRAFAADDLRELLRRQRAADITHPSLLVKELDPAVERVILRCLEPDARQRPGSPLAVAMALPGGDPLAAALAAGETPSPELVAASGETGPLSVRAGLSALAVFLAVVLAFTVLRGKVDLIGRVPLEKSPLALAQQAAEILHTMGYTQTPLDTAMNIHVELEALRYVEKHASREQRWDWLARHEPPVIDFAYRQSPRYLEPWSTAAGFFGISGVRRVTPYDPPLAVAGEALVELDFRGRLHSLDVVPPEVEENPPTQPVAPPDWNLLFSAAGLDPAAFQPAPPTWAPAAICDTRAAWVEAQPPGGARARRIEAAGWRGRPMFFRVIGPWTVPRAQAVELSSTLKPANLVGFSIFLFAVVGAGLLARRNLRLGRADRRGALRLAAFFFSALGAIGVLGSHHAPTITEVSRMMWAVAAALFWTGVAWLFYAALEPQVRRRRPATLITWTRLLSGGLRDPQVGRDLLLGSIAGALLTLIKAAEEFLRLRAGGVPAVWTTWGPLEGDVVTPLLRGIVIAGFHPLMYLWLFLLFRILLRHELLAAAAWVVAAVVSTPFPWALIVTATGMTPSAVATGFALVTSTLWIVVLLRLGLLATAAALFVNCVLLMFPLTLDFGLWYAWSGAAALVFVAALAGYGFLTALAGRPLFKEELLDA